LSKLTNEESLWLSDVQALLSRRPSKRLGFYTIGDPTLVVFDAEAVKRFEAQNAHLCEQMDYSEIVDAAGARRGSLEFPNNVHATRG
jgi:hypothetical protein